MQNINFQHNEGVGFQITDFPDAAKVISLRGEKVQELADMALHLSDLNTAERCLDTFNDATRNEFERSVFWKMAIINYMKCFGKNYARSTALKIEEIVPYELMGQEAHAFFKDVRDKNIAHDDNSIAQCLPGAVLNKPEAAHKIEKIITMNVLGEVSDVDNVNNLRQLILVARQYIEVRYDQLCDDLTDELEKRQYSDLIEMDDLVYKKSEVDEFSKNRSKLKS